MKNNKIYHKSMKINQTKIKIYYLKLNLLILFKMITKFKIIYFKPIITNKFPLIN